MHWDILPTNPDNLATVIQTDFSIGYLSEQAFSALCTDRYKVCTSGTVIISI
jgi:hypothetical protein